MDEQEPRRRVLAWWSRFFEDGGGIVDIFLNFASS